MAVFNGEHYIAESIESVLNQTYKDLELLVVNDGSVDNTLDIVRKYARIDDRVRVITRPNSGRPSFPKNDGIAEASGEYICFLDHDDLYDSKRTELLVAGLDAHPDWIAAFHDVRFIDSDGGNLPDIYLADSDFLQKASPYLTNLSEDWFECSEKFFIFQSLVAGAIHTSSVLIAKNRLPEGIIHFDTQFTICDDTDLWIRLGLQGKMGFLNQVLSSYRQHQASITRNIEKFRRDTALLHKVNFKRIEKLLDKEQISQLRKKNGGCTADIGYLQYQQFRMAESRVSYQEALKWSMNWRYVLAYLKTYIPAGIIKILRPVG